MGNKKGLMAMRLLGIFISICVGLCIIASTGCWNDSNENGVLFTFEFHDETNRSELSPIKDTYFAFIPSFCALNLIQLEPSMLECEVPLQFFPCDSSPSDKLSIILSKNDTDKKTIILFSLGFKLAAVTFDSETKNKHFNISMTPDIGGYFQAVDEYNQPLIYTNLYMGNIGLAKNIEIPAWQITNSYGEFWLPSNYPNNVPISLRTSAMTIGILKPAKNNKFQVIF